MQQNVDSLQGTKQRCSFWRVPGSPIKKDIRRMVTEQEIINKYLGVPYLHQGRTMAGVDCWGMVLLIYKDMGYKLWDIDEDYDKSFNWKSKNYFIENYYREWDKVEIPELFDLIFFKKAGGQVSHAGVLLKRNRFIHTSDKTGTVVTRLLGNLGRYEIEGFYHLRRRNDNN